MQHGNCVFFLFFYFMQTYYSTVRASPTKKTRGDIPSCSLHLLQADVVFSCKHTRQELVHNPAHLQSQGKIQFAFNEGTGQ